MFRYSRILSMVLILTILISSLSTFYVNAEETEDTEETEECFGGAKEEYVEPEILTVWDYYNLKGINPPAPGPGGGSTIEPLPSAVDNSESPYFPEITNQGRQLSCSAFSTAYYQFTYTVNKARGVPTTAENTFSPSFVYNLANELEYDKNGNPIDGASFPTVCYNILKNYGCPSIKSIPYDEKNYLSWCTDPDIWREAYRYRLKAYHPFEPVGDLNTQITSHDDPDLDIIKTALSNGDILRFSTHAGSWERSRLKINSNVPENNKYRGEYYIKYVSGNYDFHSVVLVGYNDNIWCDINNNGKVDNGEMGAMKVANSWGKNKDNDGFIWLAYDAFNLVSSVDGVGYQNGRRNDILSIQSISVEPPQETQNTKEIYVKFTLNTSDRSQVHVNFTGGKNGSVNYDTFLSCVNYTKAVNRYSFDGTQESNDGTFIYPLKRLIKYLNEYNFDSYDFAIEVIDSNPNQSPVILKDVSLVNEYTGKEYKIGNELPVTVGRDGYMLDLKGNATICYTGLDKPYLHYRTTDGQFKKVSMDENYRYNGYMYTYELNNVSNEILLYFSDDNGNIDDNDGKYYKADIGMNYFNSENPEGDLRIKTFEFANGDAVMSTQKPYRFNISVYGGYAPYDYSYTFENLDTGEVEVYDSEYDFTKTPYRFAKTGKYRITLEVCDRSNKYATATKEISVDNNTFHISSVTQDKANPVVSNEIVFESKTSYENIALTGKKPESYFEVKNSDGIRIWRETVPCTSYDALLGTSTTRFAYKPTKSGYYTLTITTQDDSPKTATKIIPFRVNDMKIGDVDGDGNISVFDATHIQMYLARIITEHDMYSKLADCDEDSKINIMDATYVLEYIADKATSGRIGEVVEYVSHNTITFTNTIGYENVYCAYTCADYKMNVSFPGMPMTPIGVNSNGDEVYMLEIPKEVEYLVFNDGNAETNRVRYYGGERHYVPIPKQLNYFNDVVETNLY